MVAVVETDCRPNLAFGAVVAMTILRQGWVEAELYAGATEEGRQVKRFPIEVHISEVPYAFLRYGANHQVEVVLDQRALAQRSEVISSERAQGIMKGQVRVAGEGGRTLDGLLLRLRGQVVGR